MKHYDYIMETKPKLYQELCQHYCSLTSQNNTRNYSGTKINKVCIFCGKQTPDVTFKKDAHIIPAGLGNRTLFNYNECDQCNEYIFSPQENELINYLTMDRILIRGRKRSGAPKFKPDNSKSYIESKPGENVVSIYIDDQEEYFGIEDLNEEDTTVKMKVNNPPPYRLLDICKCLVHMAWSVIDKEKINQFPHITEWLLGKREIFPLYLDVGFIPGNGMANVILEVWESSASESKPYALLIRFVYGYKVLTFYVPTDISNIKEPERFFYFQHASFVRGTGLVIHDDRRTYPDCLEFTFSYKSKISNDAEDADASNV